MPPPDAGATAPQDSSAEPQPDAAAPSPDDTSSPDTPSAANTASAADDATAGLPDWAVQKMQEMEAADGASAEQDAPPPAPAAPQESAAPQEPVAPVDAPPEAIAPPVSEQLRESAPNIDLMLDLPLDVSVELGRAEMPLAHVLALDTGAVIQLDRLPGEPLDLLVNGRLVARGEIVVLNDTFAFRITDLIES